MSTTSKRTLRMNSLAKQAGMTLIELSVVLLILVGLAGLLVPYVSGFAEKTHDATGANSISELDSTVLRFQADKMRFPNKMENLINNTAATAAAKGTCVGAAIDTVYCHLMNSAHFAVTTLNMTSVMSLSMAGITTVLPTNPDTTDATFKSVLSTTPLTLTSAATPLATETKLVAAIGLGGGGGEAAFTTIEDHMAAAFGGNANDYDSTCYDYVAFGIGDNNDMVGTQLHSAPVHFASQGAMGPTEKYNRFISVFQVDKLATASAASAVKKGCGVGNSPAKFIGTGMNMGVKTFIGKAANSQWVYSRMASK